MPRNRTFESGKNSKLYVYFTTIRKSIVIIVQTYTNYKTKVNLQKLDLVTPRPPAHPFLLYGRLSMLCVVKCMNFFECLVNYVFYVSCTLHLINSSKNNYQLDVNDLYLGSSACSIAKQAPC